MKKWYLSKSIWLGVIAIVIAVLDAIHKGASWEVAAIAGIGAAGIALRTLTNLPLSK